MHLPQQQKENGHLIANSEIQSCLISVRTHGAGYLQHLPHPLSLSLSVSLSLICQCLQSTLLILLFQSSHASMCWSALSDPPCALSPQLCPHKEYVITGESGPDRWLCVKPQCSPGRVILPRGHYQINNRLFFCVWESPNFSYRSLTPSFTACLSASFCFCLSLRSPRRARLHAIVEPGTRHKGHYKKGSEKRGKKSRWKCKFTAIRKL